jgi:Chibby family
MTIFGKKFVRKPTKTRDSRLISVPKLNEDVNDFILPEKQPSNSNQLVEIKKTEKISELQRKNKKLQDENLMLSTKLDILLDMMTAGLKCEETVD